MSDKTPKKNIYSQVKQLKKVQKNTDVTENLACYAPKYHGHKNVAHSQVLYSLQGL